MDWMSVTGKFGPWSEYLQYTILQLPLENDAIQKKYLNTE